MISSKSRSGRLHSFFQLISNYLISKHEFSCSQEQQTPLHIASRLGNVDIVMLLLQHGAVVDSTTKDLYTALHIAAKEGQEEVITLLKRRIADYIDIMYILQRLWTFTQEYFI